MIGPGEEDQDSYDIPRLRKPIGSGGRVEALPLGLVGHAHHQGGHPQPGHLISGHHTLDPRMGFAGKKIWASGKMLYNLVDKLSATSVTIV